MGLGGRVHDRGLVPLLTIMLMPTGARVAACFVAVVVALALTGTLSAHLGGAGRRRATVRTVLGGAVAMAVTYGIGHLVGRSV